MAVGDALDDHTKRTRLARCSVNVCEVTLCGSVGEIGKDYKRQNDQHEQLHCPERRLLNRLHVLIVYYIQYLGDV